MGPQTWFTDVADLVAESGGVLGMVTLPLPDLTSRLQHFFGLATDPRGLDADFHVDETMDPAERNPARDRRGGACHGALRAGSRSAILLLALPHRNEARANGPRSASVAKRAGLKRGEPAHGATYTFRIAAPGTPLGVAGITLVHEMKARGIPVAIRLPTTPADPFYAYGDLDIARSHAPGHPLRPSRTIPDPRWPARTSTRCPTQSLGSTRRASPAARPPLSSSNARRDWTEGLFSRPQSDRIGASETARPSDRTLPGHAELDHLNGASMTPNVRPCGARRPRPHLDIEEKEKCCPRRAAAIFFW